MDIPVAKVQESTEDGRSRSRSKLLSERRGRFAFGDFIEDRAVVGLYRRGRLINVNLKDQTRHVLRTLTPRERETVIKSAFAPRKTWQASTPSKKSASSFAVYTRQRIRQIEAKGAEEVGSSASSRCGKLRAFWMG